MSPVDPLRESVEHGVRGTDIDRFGVAPVDRLDAVHSPMDRLEP